MATNFLNQNFDDEEDEDDDFNPAPGAGSDDEGDAKGEPDDKPRISRQPSERPRRPFDDDEDDDRANGGSSPPGDETGLGDDADAGEDDEGEGEDLRDDDDEDEDEDDEEAISVRQTSLGCTWKDWPITGLYGHLEIKNSVEDD